MLFRSDKGDGIPNILSPSDCFVREIRQKSMSKPALEKFLSEDITNNNNETIKAGFMRNQTLIDLSFIPTEIKQRIINNYEEFKPAPKQKLFNYFVEKKLMNLIDSIGDY